MLLFYNAISIPLHLAFVRKVSPLVIAWFAFDYTSDIFFIVDIVLRYRCFAFYSAGVLVTDINQIASNYMKNGMSLRMLPPRF